MIFWYRVENFVVMRMKFASAKLYISSTPKSVFLEILSDMGDDISTNSISVVVDVTAFLKSIIYIILQHFVPTAAGYLRISV